MTLPIQFELTDGQIRAFVNGSVNVSVTAPTLTDAVARLQTAVPHTNGHVKMTSPAESDAQEGEMDTWKPFAGIWKDDPMFDDWMENMKLRREQENKLD